MVEFGSALAPVYSTRVDDSEFSEILKSDLSFDSKKSEIFA